MSQDYEPVIGYVVIMNIDGQNIASIEGYSFESIAEQWRKLDHAKERSFEVQEGLAVLRQE
jgi:hypothetical protein